MVYWHPQPASPHDVKPSAKRSRPEGGDDEGIIDNYNFYNFFEIDNDT